MTGLEGDNTLGSHRSRIVYDISRAEKTHQGHWPEPRGAAGRLQRPHPGDLLSGKQEHGGTAMANQQKSSA